MTEAIIVALITGVLTLVGVIISNSRSNAVQAERIEQLRAEVKKHNGLIERTYKLEDRANLTDAELKRLDKRLSIVESKGDK